MDIPRIDYNKSYRLLSKIWDSSLPGKGTLSRFLSKRIIPRAPGKLISKTMYGFDLLIDPIIDNGVEHSLYYFGTYEKGTLGFIKESLKEGSVFFDIGANIGLMSIYASFCVGKAGKIIAFEANPETAELLRYNSKLNSIENITVVDKAVGNKSGRIKIYNNWHINRGGSTLIKPMQETGSFEVDMVKIDELSEYKDLQVDLIKIDVEGFELDVLKGISDILSRERAPRLIIECSADRSNNYASVNEIFDFVTKEKGYTVFRLHRGKERNGRLIEVKTKEELPQHDNIFCIKK